MSNWRPDQLTDSELNHEITAHEVSLKETPEGSLAYADLESALAVFVLERDERKAARQRALDREVKSWPEY